jgi:hypothetical protein
MSIGYDDVHHQCADLLQRLPLSPWDMDVGGGDDRTVHQAERVDHDVTLAALDLLAGVKALDSAAFGGLDPTGCR